MISEPLILASASPRRRALLEQFGISLRIEIPSVDERPRLEETATELALRLARWKGEAVLARRRTFGSVVLSADTVVELDGWLLGKPTSDEEAVEMLLSLSGRTHRVVTGVFASGPLGTGAKAVETLVRFRELTPAEARWYAATGEPRDKAGGYAVQGIGGAFVSALSGSPSNVIGLPLDEALALIAQVGFTLPWARG